MIVECTGLPGAGKTTVCRLVSVPHSVKGAVPLTALRPNMNMLRAARHILALSLTVRPFRLKRLKRAFNLIVFLRHYEHPRMVILFDQGIVQKIWSIMADANAHSGERLRLVMTSLLPFAPDWVVWLETPLAAAVQRLHAREDGNSRYDKLPPDEILRHLTAQQALLRNLAEQFCSATNARLLEIDGMQPASANAKKIDTLFKTQNPRIASLS